jgi:hypothetical protein
MVGLLRQESKIFLIISSLIKSSSLELDGGVAIVLLLFFYLVLFLVSTFKVRSLDMEGSSISPHIDIPCV